MVSNINLFFRKIIKINDYFGKQILLIRNIMILIKLKYKDEIIILNFNMQNI